MKSDRAIFLYDPWAKTFDENDRSHFIGVLDGVVECKHTYSPPGNITRTTNEEGQTQIKIEKDTDEISLLYNNGGSHADEMDVNYILYIVTPIYKCYQAFRIRSFHYDSKKNLKVTATHVKYDLKNVKIPWLPFRASDFDKNESDKIYQAKSSIDDIRKTLPILFKNIFAKNEQDRQIEVKTQYFIEGDSATNHRGYAYVPKERYLFPDYSSYGFSIVFDNNTTENMDFSNLKARGGPAMNDTFVDPQPTGWGHRSGVSYPSGMTRVYTDENANITTKLSLPMYSIDKKTQDLYTILMKNIPEGYAYLFDNFVVRVVDATNLIESGSNLWYKDPIKGCRTLNLYKHLDVDKYGYTKTFDEGSFNGTVIYGSPQVGDYYISRIPYSTNGNVVGQGERLSDDPTWTTYQKIHYTCYVIPDVYEYDVNKADEVYASVYLDENDYEKPYVTRYEFKDLGDVTNLREQIVGNQIGAYYYGYTQYTYFGETNFPGVGTYSCYGVKPVVFDVPEWDCEVYVYVGDEKARINDLNGATGNFSLTAIKGTSNQSNYELRDTVYDVEYGTYGWYTDEQTKAVAKELEINHTDPCKKSATMQIKRARQQFHPGDSVEFVDPATGIEIKDTIKTVTYDIAKERDYKLTFQEDKQEVIDNLGDALADRAVKVMTNNIKNANQALYSYTTSDTVQSPLQEIVFSDGRVALGESTPPEETYVERLYNEDSLTAYLEADPTRTMDDVTDYLKEMVAEMSGKVDIYSEYLITQILNDGFAFSDYETGRKILDSYPLSEELKKYLLYAVFPANATYNEEMAKINPMQINSPVAMALYYASSTGPNHRYIDKTDMLSYQLYKYYPEFKEWYGLSGNPNEITNVVSGVLTHPETYYDYSKDMFRQMFASFGCKTFTKAKADLMYQYVQQMYWCDVLLYNDITDPPSIKDWLKNLRTYCKKHAFSIPANDPGYFAWISTTKDVYYWSDLAPANSMDGYIPIGQNFAVTPGWTSYRQKIGKLRNGFNKTGSWEGYFTEAFAYNEIGVSDLNKKSTLYVPDQFCKGHERTDQFQAKGIVYDILVPMWACWYYEFDNVFELYKESGMTEAKATLPLSDIYWTRNVAASRFVPTHGTDRAPFLDFYIYPLRNFAESREFETIKTGITYQQASCCSLNFLRSLADDEDFEYDISDSVWRMMQKLYTSIGLSAPENIQVIPTDTTPPNILRWKEKYPIATLVEGREWIKNKLGNVTEPELIEAYNLIGSFYKDKWIVPSYIRGCMDSSPKTAYTQHSAAWHYVYSWNKEIVHPFKLLPDTITGLKKYQYLESWFQMNWFFGYRQIGSFRWKANATPAEDEWWDITLAEYLFRMPIWGGYSQRSRTEKKYNPPDDKRPWVTWREEIRPTADELARAVRIRKAARSNSDNRKAFLNDAALTPGQSYAGYTSGPQCTYEALLFGWIKFGFWDHMMLMDDVQLHEAWCEPYTCALKNATQAQLKTRYISAGFSSSEAEEYSAALYQFLIEMKEIETLIPVSAFDSLKPGWGTFDTIVGAPFWTLKEMADNFLKWAAHRADGYSVWSSLSYFGGVLKTGYVDMDGRASWGESTYDVGIGGFGTMQDVYDDYIDAEEEYERYAKLYEYEKSFLPEDGSFIFDSHQWAADGYREHMADARKVMEHLSSLNYIYDKIGYDYTKRNYYTGHKGCRCAEKLHDAVWYKYFF